MDIVVANNAIRLCEIGAAVVADQGTFRNMNVSLATIDHVLRRNHVAMKQLCRVPFQKNSEVVKKARCQHVEVRIHCYTAMLCHTFNWSQLTK